MTEEKGKRRRDVEEEEHIYSSCDKHSESNHISRVSSSLRSYVGARVPWERRSAPRFSACTRHRHDICSQDGVGSGGAGGAVAGDGAGRGPARRQVHGVRPAQGVPGEGKRGDRGAAEGSQRRAYEKCKASVREPPMEKEDTSRMHRFVWINTYQLTGTFFFH